MAFEEPTPQDAESIIRPVELPLIPPAAREPFPILVTGILLFAILLATSWWRGSQREPASTIQSSLEARLSTYAITYLLYQQQQGKIPRAFAASLGVERLATRTADIWRDISDDAVKAEETELAALTRVNAAALYGVAGQSRRARAALIRAIQLDPPHARGYRALQPLYQERARPTNLAPARAVLAQLSTAPLIRARDAQLRQQPRAVLAALQPGATAGLRVIITNVTLLFLYGGIFVGGLVLLLYLFVNRRITGVVREVTAAPAPQLPWGVGTALALVSITYLFAQALVALVRRLTGVQDTGVLLAIGSMSIIVSALLVLGLFLLGLGRKPWSWSIFGWRRVRGSIWVGAAGYLISLPLVFLAAQLGRLIEQLTGGNGGGVNQLITSLLEAHNPWVQLYLAVIAVVMAPVVEETLFRGILFRALGARLPFWAAAVISGVLFALAHGEFLTVLPISVLGIIFAILARYTRSLTAPAIAHACNNAVVSLVWVLLAWALRGPGS